MKNVNKINENIYITSDEDIKDVRPHKGKWQLEKGQILNQFPDYLTDLSECKLVILTTDPQLIADGVQAIDDEFLEWFVKNPSCEEVEVRYTVDFNSKAVIIIPKEDPKQETLEEVRKVERTELFNSIFSVVKQIPRKDVDGDAMDAPSCAYEIEQLFYKWQQEQDKNKYSEEEMLDITKQSYGMGRSNYTIKAFNEWFKQFKNN
jgi:hypothetical protein